MNTKITFPIVYIPEGMTWLLETHFNNSKKSNSAITDAIFSNPFIKIQISKLFKQYMKESSIDSLVASLGWKGLRDRLASMYLYHFENGVFPNLLSTDNVEDITEFENKFTTAFPDGNSRVFVLGMFFKFCDISIRKDDPENLNSYLSVSDTLLKIIRLGEQKVVKPDWLILTLIHLESYLGADVLYDLVEKNNGNFYNFFGMLNENQKEEMVQNLLRYGASINEDEMFLFEKV
jgi:hypothetical protein